MIASVIARPADGPLMLLVSTLIRTGNRKVCGTSTPISRPLPFSPSATPTLTVCRMTGADDPQAHVGADPMAADDLGEIGRSFSTWPSAARI